MRKLNITEEEMKERRRIQMISYGKTRREKDKLNGKVHRQTEAQKKISNERAKLKRLRLKKEGKLIVTKEQKEKKRIRDKKYREKIKLAGTRKKPSDAQKIKIKEYLVKYKEAKKDFIKERGVFFYRRRKAEGKINSVKINTYREVYYANNKQNVRKVINEWARNKRKNDNLFLIKCRVRGRMGAAFKSLKTKKPYTSNKLIGTDWETLRFHLEKSFRDGMNWDNKGLWHIDHIIPLASAKTEEEMIKLCHYTNLQPLWAIDNIKKGAKMPINI